MIKRILALVFLLVLIFGGYTLYKFKLGKTGFAKESKMLYIHTNAANKEAILKTLKRDSICTDINGFEFMANRAGYWQKIKPGRYKINKNTSIIGLLRIMRNGTQTPVELVIRRKIRL